MAYVTSAKCWVCNEGYTQVNGKPWACPKCYPKERERLEQLEKDLKAMTEKYFNLKGLVNGLYPAIVHGDKEHQKWLADKLSEHFGESL